MRKHLPRIHATSIEGMSYYLRISKIVRRHRRASDMGRTPVNQQHFTMSSQLVESSQTRPIPQRRSSLHNQLRRQVITLER